MELTNGIFLILVGTVAGFINVFAGSGSLMTLPLLIFTGIPANIANGTNRIAIFMQNLIAVASFKKQKTFTFQETHSLTIPTIIGTIVGSLIAVETDKETMEIVIGALLIIMFFIIILKPKAWTQTENTKEKPTSPFHYILFFLIGIYGGFIHAGVGLFLLTSLVMLKGFNIIKANAIKLYIVLIFTAFALVIFVVNGKVNYSAGIVLGIGNMIGAFVATLVAKKINGKFIKYLLLLIISISALKLFGIFNLFFD